MTTDELLTRVARALSWLDTRPVFVGGATISLYLDPAPGRMVRETVDVDLIVPQVASRGQYLLLEEELRARGWQPDPLGPVCRYVSPGDGIPVDFMAADPAVLGFSGRWYPAAVEYARDHELSTGCAIRVPAVPFLLACKLEAFWDRGRDDPYVSKDLEDVVALVDGCSGLCDAVRGAPQGLRLSVAGYISGLVADPLIANVLEGHLPNLGDALRRGQRLWRRLAELAEGLPD